MAGGAGLAGNGDWQDWIKLDWIGLDWVGRGMVILVKDWYDTWLSFCIWYLAFYVIR